MSYYFLLIVFDIIPLVDVVLTVIRELFVIVSNFLKFSLCRYTLTAFLFFGLELFVFVTCFTLPRRLFPIELLDNTLSLFKLLFLLRII